MPSYTKLLKFDKRTIEAIIMRDKGCIFCQMGYHMNPSPIASDNYIMDIMHYIPKSSMGLGIEENGVCGCRYHHHMCDNGNQGLRKEMLEIIENYLRKHYPDWDKSKLIYKKWG